MEDWEKRLEELSFTKGYYFKLEDNGLVEKKDDQLIFNREVLEAFIKQEISKAREEGIKRLGTFTAREGDELCEVLKVGERYFRSWDLESYKSGIEEISKGDFKKLSKLKSKQE